MKLYYLSIFLSLGCIIIAIKINYEMAMIYETTSGKNQALFGLTSIERLYYALLGVLALLTSIVSLVKRENTAVSIFSAILAMAAVFLTFTDLWRLWI